MGQGGGGRRELHCSPRRRRGRTADLHLDLQAPLGLCGQGNQRLMLPRTGRSRWRLHSRGTFSLRGQAEAEGERTTGLKLLR